MKVIFDTDPGIDDAMALLYLSKLPQVELLGITTVVGNADLDTTTRNALFLRQQFGLSAPVVRGAGKTLDGVDKAEPVIVHGLNGLGEIDIPEVDESGLHPGEASQFIIDTLRAYPGEVTRIKAKFETPGQFVWHCHIVEHEDNEMMRPYRIGPKDPGAPVRGM